VAYDVCWNIEPHNQLIRRRAVETGATLVESLAALAGQSDLVIGVVPGGACIEVAQALKPLLRSRHLYVDLAAATPHVKQEVGALLAGSGASVADGAIMSSPLEDGHRLRILASGPGAEAFRSLMALWGMRIEVVGARIGAASGIKSLRSVFTKGAGALVIECVLASARYGLHEQVLSSIAEWMDRRPFLETARYWLTSDAIHAVRRAHESDMSAETVAEVGLDPIMTRATAARLHWLANLELKEHFQGVLPAGPEEVLLAIEAKLGEEMRS